ncbi:MAG: hypothetical protein AAFU49_21495 [Pseudomonadota bacterium]
MSPRQDWRSQTPNNLPAWRPCSGRLAALAARSKHPPKRVAGPGLGANLNLPIPRGTGDQGFLETVDRGLARIGAFGTDLLVIALGLDAYEGHPFAGLTFITPGLARMATAIVGLDLPSVIVQKGGHLCPELGANLESFLGADAP